MKTFHCLLAENIDYDTRRHTRRQGGRGSEEIIHRKNGNSSPGGGGGGGGILLEFIRGCAAQFMEIFAQKLGNVAKFPHISGYFLNNFQSLLCALE